MGSLIILGFFLALLASSRAGSRFYKIEKFGACPDVKEKNPIIYFGNLSASYGKTGLKLMGELPFKEKITSDIDVRIKAIRCEIKLPNCVEYANQRVSKICGIIASNPVFGDKFSKITEPPFKCHPMKSTEFVMQNSSFDLTPLDFWPISGWRWKATFYFSETPKNTERGRALGCLHLEGTVSESGSRGKPKGR